MQKITGYKFPPILKRDEFLPFLVMSAGKCAEQSIYRPDGIAHHQLLFTLKGCGEAVINGKKIRVPEGAVMYHEPKCMHKYYPATDVWLTEWVTFEQKTPLMSIKSGVYRPGDISVFLDLCDKLIDTEQNIYFQENATAILYDLIVKIQSRLSGGDDADKLAPAIAYMEKNFGRDISLDDISEACMLSKEYFCRLFKNAYHTTVFSYVKSIRLREAKKLLTIHKNASVAKIAEEVGYNSANYFVTDFKKNEGVTPTEFRNLSV